MPSGISTNRTNITLPADVSDEILQQMKSTSAIMQLARTIPLPGRGAQIPVITSDPEAGWVDETGAEPVSNPGLSTKLMTPYKMAVIVPFSDEFRRDGAALYDALIERLPGALALKFDKSAVGAVNAPGSNFDTFAACTAQTLLPNSSTGTTAYDGLVAALADIADNGGSLNGYAISPAGKGLLLSAVDGNKRPLFINSAAEGAVDLILGARAVEGKGCYKAGTASTTPAVVGIAGDWTKAMVGTVEGVKIGFADQASLTINNTQVNLWERGMFAVRAEIEIGFRADTTCFNKLTGVTPTA